jgi:hypothetical protein
MGHRDGRRARPLERRRVTIHVPPLPLARGAPVLVTIEGDDDGDEEDAAGWLASQRITSTAHDNAKVDPRVLSWTLVSCCCVASVC